MDKPDNSHNPAATIMAALIHQAAEDVAHAWVQLQPMQDKKLDTMVHTIAAGRVMGMMAPMCGYSREQYLELAEHAWNFGVRTLMAALDKMKPEEREMLRTHHPFFQNEANRKAALAQAEVEETHPQPPFEVPISVLQALGEEGE